MLLAREWKELDFMNVNVKEEGNCGLQPYCNLAWPEKGVDATMKDLPDTFLRSF